MSAQEAEIRFEPADLRALGGVRTFMPAGTNSEGDTDWILVLETNS